MATYAFVDLDDTFIEMTINGSIVRNIKKKYITFGTPLVEPVLDIYFHNYERIKGGNLLSIDFNDVTAPVVVSAAALQAALQVMIDGAGGSGDVVGPSSAVDGNIAVFDTTTGKLIADSGVNTAAINLFNHMNLI